MLFYTGLRYYFLHIILSCLGMMMASMSFGQEIETLQQRLQGAINDSSKVEVMTMLSQVLLDSGRLEESIEYAENAMSLSQDASNLRLLNILARATRQQEKYAASLNYYLQSQKELAAMDQPRRLAEVNTEVGELYQEWGILEKAVDYFELGLKGWEELEEQDKVIYLLKRSAATYQQLGNYEKALEYSKKQLTYIEKEEDPAKKVAVLSSISNLNVNLNQIDEALTTQEDILSIYQGTGDSVGISSAYNNIGFLSRRQKKLEQSLKSFQQSIKYAINPSPVTYVNIGVIHQVLGNYEPSLLSFFEAAKIQEKAGNKEEVARVCNYISAVYQTLDDSENALRYTERAIKFGEESGSKETLATSYKALSDIYAGLGRNKRALGYYKEYASTKQAAQQEANQELKKALERQVEAEEQENELKLLLVDKELSQLSLRRLQLEAEKKQQDYQLQLQQQRLANAALEQKELEKEKNLQRLILEKGRIEAAQKDSEIKTLQASDSIQRLALKQKELEEQERLKDIELLKQREEVRRLQAEEEKAKASQERQKLLIGIGVGAMILLFILVGLILQRRANAKLRMQQQQLNKQNLKLQEQADEITVQAEELMQQKDEIIAQRDYIEDKNIELERQKDTIQKSYDNIRILSDIGQQITATLDLSLIIRTVYESVNRLMDAASFGIGIYNEKLDALEFKDFIEKDEVLPYSIDYIKDDSLPSVQCFVEKKEIVINNLKEAYDMFSLSTEDNRGEVPSSLIYMPLKIEDRSIGVITVQSFQDNAYSDTELTILRSLASYATIALENSNSYDQLMAVNEIIKEKNDQITDSLRYASTIEESILPTPGWFEEHFDSYFTIYRPKDIVSGDFYWGHSADGYTVLAVVDCTGHGVPGAFMSMIGNALLNRIIRENKEYDPGTILVQLNQGVKDVLNQQEHGRSEGMDVCLCRLKQIEGEDSIELAYAGAKRPLYYMAGGELAHLKGDKLSIGWLRKKEDSTEDFTTQTIYLPSGSLLYLTTDGFVDNPSPHRSKIGTGKLKKMLNEHQEDLEALGQDLNSLLDQAAEVREQRDDVTLIGVKLQ